MRLFSYDSKFSQIMLKLCYGCYLNLLWMVCSLPVFTAGAATAALYDVTLRLAREEEPPLTRQFFKAFRENFRQATILWLILLGVGALLGADGYILYRLSTGTTGVVPVVCTLALALIIKRSKEQKKNPYKQEIFTDAKDFQLAMARAEDK